MSKWIYLLFLFLEITCFVKAKIKLSKLAKHSDVKWIRTNVKFIKKFLKQGGGENTHEHLVKPAQENVPIRKNLTTLDTELTLLNEALENMKKGDTKDWMSFENVANYHGRPNLCKNDWNMTHPDNPDGEHSRGCCVHYHNKNNRLPYFAAWHRLFMVNFESSLKRFGSSSLTLPYWDWTELTNTPNGLPVLADNDTYPEWKNGPKKGKHGAVTHRKPGDYFAKLKNIKTLKRGVKNSYCTTKYHQYDLENQTPHNAVHNNMHGDMGDNDYAAYDPIFYLHHSFVDLQYAYWQKLQHIRGLPALAKFSNRQMPPFSNYTPNEDININPIAATKAQNTQFSTRYPEYITNYNYQYDQLIFDGKTPEEFHEAYDSQCLNKSKLGYTVKDYKIPSTNRIFAVYSGSEFEVDIYYTFPVSMDPILGLHHTSDVTDSLEENGIPVEEIRNVHYKVYSDDGNGNSIDSNLYKPTNEYIDANEEITIRYHVNYFDQYCSILRLNEEVAWLEFLNDDGSFATGVTSDGSQIPASPYLLIDPQTFNYGGISIKIIL